MLTQKKIIILSVVAVLVIVGGTVGILYALRSSTQPVEEQNPTINTEPIYIVDTSKDYGACTWLEKTAIKDALGNVAANLQGPDNVGRAGRVQSIEGGPEGTVTMDSQTCVYGFEPGGKIENGFNGDNGFTLIASQLEAQKDHDQLVENYNEDTMFGKVDGLGDAAFYKANVGEQYAISSFELVVVEGLKAYTYAINQPADDTTFTAESAKTALRAIAVTKN